MCVPEKNPYNPISTMYSCETLDCLGVHVCSDIDTEARSERALINVKKSPIFKTSDACRRVMLLLLPPPPPPPPLLLQRPPLHLYTGWHRRSMPFARIFSFARIVGSWTRAFRFVAARYTCGLPAKLGGPLLPPSSSFNFCFLFFSSLSPYATFVLLRLLSRLSSLSLHLSLSLSLPSTEIADNSSTVSGLIASERRRRRQPVVLLFQAKSSCVIENSRPCPPPLFPRETDPSRGN